MNKLLTFSALANIGQYGPMFLPFKETNFKNYYTWIQSRERTNRTKKRKRK